MYSSFVNDWPEVLHDTKWNPMEYWFRNNAITTTQAATVQTTGKPTTASATTASATTANPTSGEHEIFIELPLYYIQLYEHYIIL